MTVFFPEPKGENQVFLPFVASTKFEEEPEEEKGIINGQVARSKEEYMVAKALWALNWDFYYQFPMFGGYMAGGYLIDFLVFLPPKPTPLEVQSEHWHSQKNSPFEQLRKARIENALDVKIRYVWEWDLTNESDAIVAVRKAMLGPVSS